LQIVTVENQSRLLEVNIWSRYCCRRRWKKTLFYCCNLWKKYICSGWEEHVKDTEEHTRL